jgi:nicotinamide riboside kinase
MANHLIFEGAELAGKSWLMSQVYDQLEARYNQNKVLLDGCHWFNCDVGIFGTEHGRPIIGHYLNIFKELSSKNLLIEKFHLSDIVYNRLHFGREPDYIALERELLELDFRIILVRFPREEAVLKQRIKDRLNLYPHYEKILRSPAWYIAQQDEYERELKRSSLKNLIIDTNILPDQTLVKKIMAFIGEEYSA